MSEDKLMDAKEVARELSISVSWVYDHTPRANGDPAPKRPALPVVHLGGRARYRRSSIVAWVAENEVRA